jgi:hypothetical protein
MATYIHVLIFGEDIIKITKELHQVLSCLSVYPRQMKAQDRRVWRANLFETMHVTVAAGIGEACARWLIHCGSEC